MSVFEVDGLVTITVPVTRKIEASSANEAAEIYKSDGVTHEQADIEQSKGRESIQEIEVEWIEYQKTGKIKGTV